MIDIKDINDNVKASVKVTAKAIYHKELMSEEYVLLSFDSDKLLNLTHGDYIDCEFGRFYIVNIDKPVSASNGGYTYEQKFNAGWERWSKFLLFYDRQKGYEKSWKLTSFVENFMNIIVSNLKEAGFGTFTYTVDSTVNHVMKLVEFDGTDIISALTKIAEAWETEWWITDNIIHIGYCSIGTPVDIKRGEIITDMRASDSQDTDYITRLYAFGSTRNIPKDYRKDEDGNLVIEGVVERRLKLPEGIDHVDAWDNPAKEDIVEGVAIFDDIYPHRIGTIDSVTTKEYTDTTENEDGTTTSAKWNAYRFTDTGITFSDDYRIEGQDLHIIFQTGSLAGMDFVVSFNPDKVRDDDPAAQLWEIIRNDAYGVNIPNDAMKPKVGDTYVLYGYDTKLVSDTLIPEAEQELLKQAQELVKKKSGDKSVYEMPSNPVRCAGYKKVDGKLSYNVSDVIDFDIGQAVTLYNDVYFKGGSRTTRIRAFEKRLDNKYNCTYTAGEASSYSRSKELEQKVSELTFQSNTFVSGGGTSIYVIKRYDRTTPSDYNVFSALKTLATCLRKDQDDTASNSITFQRIQKFFGGLIFGKDGFASGLTGFGGQLDANGYGEMQGLTLWHWLEVPEFRYNRVVIKIGDSWSAPGAGIVKSAAVDKDDKGNNLNTGTVTLKLEDGEYGAVAKGDICMGIFHSTKSSDNATADSDDSRGNRQFAGFFTAYFTITEVSGDNNETFKYQLRPVSERWKGQFHPCEAMNFVSYGSFTDVERQTSTYTTRTYTRRLWKQNTWEISAANIAMQDGDLSNLKVHGMDMTGYSVYLNSVYFTGTINQVKPDGTPVHTANDRGAWAKGHYDFYDRVSHDGRIWICVNEDGTDSEPAVGNADWLLQVDKGSDGKDGKSVKSVDVWYYLSTSDTTQTGGTWSTTPPQWEKGKYYWQKTITTYTDNTTSESRPAIIPNGGDGKDGVGIRSVVEQYYVSTSLTALQGGSWSTTAPTWQQGKYIWTRSVITYTDGSSVTTNAICASGQKGDKGDGYTQQGAWHTGLHVVKMGVVRMGGSSYVAKVETDNPPLFCYTDNQGNRLQYNDGGYVLTGEVNTAEYDVLAEKGDKGDDGKDGAPGKDGADGKDGKQGLSGCVLRDSEWALNTEYRNDENVTDGSLPIRYIDVALVRNNNAATGWDAYKCLRTHTSSASITTANTTYWEKFGANVMSIFTSLIIAKNAKIQFGQANQLLIQKDDGTVTAGMSGAVSGSKIRIWAGSSNPDSAPFRVDENGKLWATNADITGTINATAGKIAGFMIDGNTLTNRDDKGLFTNNATVLFRNDVNKTFAAIGGNVLPSVTGATGVARFENNDSSNPISGVNYAMLVSAQGAETNVAIAISGGCISGMAYRVQIVGNSSSIVTISKSVGVVLLTNTTTTVTIILPDMDAFDDGHMIKIKRLSGKDQDGIVFLQAGRGTFQDGTSKDNFIVFNNGNWSKGLQIGSPGDAMELIYARQVLNSNDQYRGAWVQFKNPRDW